MSPLVWTLTLILLALPVGFSLSAMLGTEQLAAPALIVIAIYAWVWLRFRPRHFNIHRRGLEVVFPGRA